MDTIKVILIILIFTACNSFDRDVINDPMYTSGIEGETNRPIKPVVKEFGHYTFVSGHSDTASTLGMYYKGKELKIWTSSDGYFDTVMNVNLNNDDIADFFLKMPLKMALLFTHLFQIQKLSLLKN